MVGDGCLRDRPENAVLRKSPSFYRVGGVIWGGGAGPGSLPNRLQACRADAPVAANDRHIEIDGGIRDHAVRHIRHFGAGHLQHRLNNG